MKIGRTNQTYFDIKPAIAALLQIVLKSCQKTDKYFGSFFIYVSRLQENCHILENEVE
ncbi:MULTISPECIES: hypothetical protein [Niallia]|uniref:hypothetical protein n=1 Tax=Niallia TaxID=2837506 RepID=UPI000B04E542|nr:hypothetical protein [Niallia circulans]